MEEQDLHNIMPAKGVYVQQKRKPLKAAYKTSPNNSYNIIV